MAKAVKIVSDVDAILHTWCQLQVSSSMHDRHVLASQHMTNTAHSSVVQIRPDPR